jgi:DNA-binding transcriptional MerR regulator
MGVSRRELFRTREVLEILGVTRRQLQYWAQTDLVRPSARSPGGHGLYAFADLVALKAAKRLIDAGVSVQRIRQSIRALRTLLPTVRRPLAELVLVATGDVVLAFRDGTAFEAVSGQQWVFEVAQLQREIDHWRRSAAALRSARRPRVARPVRVRDRTA